MPSPAPTAAPDLPPARTGPAPGSRLGRIDAAVHLGFAVLIVASVVRYVMRHRKNSANEHQAKLGAETTSTAQTATRTNIHSAHGRRRWASTAMTA